MRYTNKDFFNAIVHYGELEHKELMALTNNEPIFIDGHEVVSILNDDGLKYSFLKEDGREYSTPFYIEDIDKEICDKIYEFLCENWNDNYDLFSRMY